MQICEQIRAERRFGKILCGVVDGRMTIIEVARAFGLADDSAIYRPIDRTGADTLARRILQTDLAYRSEIMDASRAARLWEQFMAMFDEQDVKFATNVISPTNWNWAPATSATIDMGVLVIGSARAGCLWVEDED
jgi:hypothetical protein